MKNYGENARDHQLHVKLVPGKFDPNVLLLQQELNKLQYKGKNDEQLKEDGIFGPETHWAICSYKIDNHLYDEDQTTTLGVTGEVDMETWASIFKDPLIIPIPTGQDPARFFSYNPNKYDKNVAKIQTFLRNAGYSGMNRELLSVTGSYDFDTCIAVNFFKLNSNIDDGLTGVVTNQVYDMMFPEEIAHRKALFRSTGLIELYEEYKKQNREFTKSATALKELYRQVKQENKSSQSVRDGNPRKLARHSNSLKPTTLVRKETEREKHDKDILNSWLIKDASRPGKFEMPELKPCHKKPKKAIPFDRAAKNDNKDQWIHFFIDDSKFECVWENPKEYLNLLKSFDGVISTDYSVFLDMPLALAIWNTYRNRALAYWMQQNGIQVIPNVQWSDERSYDFCFEGIPRHSTVAKRNS